MMEGNPGHRPLNDREPKPRQVAPVCPGHVRSDPIAYKEWRRLLPILRRMKIVTEADGMILGNLCLVHSNLVLNIDNMRKLNQQSKSGLAGVIVATKSGYLAPNQLYLNIQNAIELEFKLGRELGLSPSARTRIQMAASDDDNNKPGSVLNGRFRGGA